MFSYLLLIECWMCPQRVQQDLAKKDLRVIGIEQRNGIAVFRRPGVSMAESVGWFWVGAAAG